jgi:hypothetical protein
MNLKTLQEVNHRRDHYFARCPNHRGFSLLSGVPRKKLSRIPEKMVAGVGFEPTIPQLRDYEPERRIVVNPEPPFWRLSLFSSFLASDRGMEELCQ